MDFQNIGLYAFESGDGNTVITSKIGKVKKFDMNTFKEVTTSGTTPLATSFDSSGCSCDNYVAELHYKIYFTETKPVVPPTDPNTADATPTADPS